VAVAGTSVKFSFGCCSYTATVSANGTIMKGTLYQGTSYPLEFVRASAETAWGIPKRALDTSPHKVRMITVVKNVQVEVLDWGGSGRPLIFLPGLGNTAHDFDKFAQRFTAKYHVYGITRRGIGASDKPEPIISNYAADRLGDDVLVVMDTLKIERPVLAGHSIAGSELSSVASRHPDKVAGLVYLDAAYPYAFYSPGSPYADATLNIDANDLRAKVSRLNQISGSPSQSKADIDELLKTSLPQLEQDLRVARRYFEHMPSPPAGTPSPPFNQPPDPADAVFAGIQKYASVKVPVLAIFAFPKKIRPQTAASERADIQLHDAMDGQTADLYATANPKAKVVRIANSKHDVYNSNPVEVEREMNEFIKGLPQ
jgi:non-heme chloroperoxidase